MTFCAAVSEGGVPVQSVSRAGQAPFLPTRGKSDIMESMTRKGALLMKYDGILFDLDGIWTAVIAAEGLGVLVSFGLLYANRKRYHYL